MKKRQGLLKRCLAGGCAIVIASLTITISGQTVNAQDGQPSGFPQPVSLTANTLAGPSGCAAPTGCAAPKGCVAPGKSSGCQSCCSDSKLARLFGSNPSSPFGGCCNEERIGGLPTLNSLIDGNDSGINIGGWSQTGYHSRNNGLFNNHRGDLNIHQMWFYAEKVADGSNGLDWGFRGDLMYGVDAADTQAFGNNAGEWDFQNGFDHGIYGWAMPQLYGEIASGKWSVKIGHFYTIVGYEVVTAPDNFFYSHAYTMNNSEPFTHTGALVTYDAGNDVTVYGGWTAGWDTGFDQFGSGSNFIGGVSVPVGGDATFTYITTIGDFGRRGEGYSHSMVLDMKMTEKLNWVVQSDLVNTNGGADHQYGLNQYLLYSVSDCFGLGMRAEWWKNGNNSQYEITWGVNYKPYSNFIIRPEIRHDWNPGNANNFTTFGTDFIFTF